MSLENRDFMSKDIDTSQSRSVILGGRERKRSVFMTREQKLLTGLLAIAAVTAYEVQNNDSTAPEQVCKSVIAGEAPYNTESGIKQGLFPDINHVNPADITIRFEAVNGDGIAQNPNDALIQTGEKIIACVDAPANKIG